MLTCIGLSFCQVEDGTGEDEAEGGSPHAIYYQAEFDTAGVTRTEEGLLIENDLGFAILLRGGALSTTTAQLVPCVGSAELTASDAIDTYGWSLGPRTAYAGHSVGDDDPSKIEVSLSESLTIATLSELGAALSGDTYCALGLEVGPLEDTETPTLTLELSVKIGEQWHERNVSSWNTFTRQAQLEQPLQSGRYASKVVATRKLATMFDGIAFDTISDDADGDLELANSVIVNLLSHTTLSIYTDATEDP